MDANLVVLAGGISSRMKKPGSGRLDARLAAEADAKSKGMIGVGEGGRPFLDYVLYNAREAGFRDVVIVVGEQDRSIRAYYGAADSGNPFHGMTIGYAIQPIPAGRTKPLGTADAMLWALRSRPDWRGMWFTVCNSDNLYSVRAMRILRESRADCTFIDYDRGALEFEAERIAAFSILSTDPQHRLLEIVEKPDPATAARLVGPNGRVGVSMNIFSFAYDRIAPLLERVPPHPIRQEKEIPSAVMMMLAERPGSVHTVPLAEHVPDLTSRDDIARVQEYLSREFHEFSWE
jgi:NDP-sugar pyrophosphorylase family protein